MSAALVGADFLTALNHMLDTAPMDWWRFVRCSYCGVTRQEPCQMGGMSCGPARQPHASRYRSGLSLHATFRLLTEGHAADVVSTDVLEGP